MIEFVWQFGNVWIFLKILLTWIVLRVTNLLWLLRCFERFSHLFFFLAHIYPCWRGKQQNMFVVKNQSNETSMSFFNRDFVSFTSFCRRWNVNSVCQLSNKPYRLTSCNTCFIVRMIILFKFKCFISNFIVTIYDGSIPFKWIFSDFFGCLQVE